MPARRRAAFTVALPPALTGVTATAAVSPPDDPTGPPDLTALAEADGDAWTGTFRPDRSGDSVSVRATAAADAGNTVEQELIGAFGLD